MRIPRSTPWLCIGALWLVACGNDPVVPGTDAGMAADTNGMCTGDERLTRLVYYGTPEPTALPLTDGQVLAVVNFGGCSGVFITEEWVLTADHCGVVPGAPVCVGEQPDNPNICVQAAEVYSHPTVDMTLVHVASPITNRLPQLEPVPIMTERIDSSWFGMIAEAAGYGTQETGRSGEREFTAEPIDAFEDSFVVINGQGERGVCFGDSGGPLMVLATDATVRVLGALSWGDPSCVGRDRYTRVDLVYDWVEGYTGPTAAPGGACGSVGASGDCMGDAVAVWCDAGTLASERCEAGATCGWDSAASGYRCITGEDPCDGLTYEGECRGSVATWCDDGVLRTRDCAPCGETCRDVPEVGGAYCAGDPCAGLDFLGECRGDTAVWCQDGDVQMRDCGREGLRCDYVNDRVGNFCTR